MKSVIYKRKTPEYNFRSSDSLINPQQFSDWIKASYDDDPFSIELALNGAVSIFEKYTPIIIFPREYKVNYTSWSDIITEGITIEKANSFEILEIEFLSSEDDQEYSLLEELQVSTYNQIFYEEKTHYFSLRLKKQYVGSLPALSRDRQYSVYTTLDVSLPALETSWMHAIFTIAARLYMHRGDDSQSNVMEFYNRVLGGIRYQNAIP